MVNIHVLKYRHFSIIDANGIRYVCLNEDLKDTIRFIMEKCYGSQNIQNQEKFRPNEGNT
jgi:hypothetical protein